MENRFTEIERENRILLEKITTIMHSNILQNENNSVQKRAVKMKKRPIITNNNFNNVLINKIDNN
jgi:hypothetical protein